MAHLVGYDAAAKLIVILRTEGRQAVAQLAAIPVGEAIDLQDKLDAAIRVATDVPNHVDVPEVTAVPASSPEPLPGL